MAISTQIKSTVNSWLCGLNLRLETLTEEKIETNRLEALDQSGYFEEEAFPIPQGFRSAKIEPILEELSKYSQRFNDFKDITRNDVGYTFENQWYSSPDAEILYTMIRKFRPNKIIEVGCGNSTKLMRQAIIDGMLDTQLISIDPHPRTDIEGFSDRVYRMPVESIRENEIFDSLKSGDILFIDSSHTVKSGNDVVYLYNVVIPKLNPGVLIHIHDIFLPYDYPMNWVMNKMWGWNEQYLVYAILCGNHNFEVLWAGHFLQRTLADFAQHFPHLRGFASSLWLHKSH